MRPLPLNPFGSSSRLLGDTPQDRTTRPSPFIAVAGIASVICAVFFVGHAQADDDRIVQVSGSAAERVAPDMAMLRVAAVSEAVTAQAARREADKTIAKTLEMLRGLGIASTEIDTSGLQVTPEYRWTEETRERELTGYRVIRNVDIRLLDLALLGDVLTGLSEAGINQMAPPVLGLADPEVVYQRVLAAAAMNAKARAVVLAEAMGAELGPVLRMSASNNHYPQPMRREMAIMAAAEAAASASESYQSGDLSFSVEISVTFEID